MHYTTPEEEEEEWLSSGTARLCLRCQSATFSSLLESRSCNAAFFLSVSLLESKGEDDLILAEGPPPYLGQTGTRVKRPKATRTSV